MDAPALEEQQSGLDLSDILYAVFKHKWKIVICALVGFAAAAAAFFLYSPGYQSDAKILVKYVVERNPIDSGENGMPKFGDAAANALGSEVEILTSWDLALQVADEIGVERMLPKEGGGASKPKAAQAILSGLKVTALKGSNVIAISYKNGDPELARIVLESFLSAYLKEHLKIHRSADAFEFVNQQEAKVKSRLNSTEDLLKAEKGKAGILSLPESIAALNGEMITVQTELRAAETERAEQQARLKQIEGSSGSSGGQTAVADARQSNDAKPKATPNEIQQYQTLVARLAKLRQSDLELLSRYTPESQFAKLNQAQIESAEKQRRDLETRFPDLAATAPTSVSGGESFNLSTERVRMAGVDAKVEALEKRLRDLNARAKQFLDIGPLISDLERRRSADENAYKQIAAKADIASSDQVLDASKIPNISIVQRPSPSLKVTSTMAKVLVGLAAGGLGIGLAIALGLELLLNRTVKRPMELETRLGIPLFLSIPHLLLNGKSPNGRLRLGNAPAELAKSDGAGTSPPPWEPSHFIRPYAEAVRDRLILFFELSRLTRKPKLVAVTGLSAGAGVSTLAGGLAAALSETGEGKVLLVDMNVNRAEIHPFLQGKKAYSLTEALQQDGTGMTPAAENLYLATATEANGKAVCPGPKRFYDLIPNLKASDFDYIIFDMPPVSESSATLAVAGFMDKVLFVLEAGVTDRAAAKRSFGELSAAKANVSGIFNKTRDYAPKWLKAGL